VTTSTLPPLGRPTRWAPRRPGLRVVRHELRNALSAASVHLDLLTRSGHVDAEVERLDAIRDALDQALGLSDRLASLPPAPRAERAEVGSIVRQCSRLARPLVEARGTLAQDLPEQIGEIRLSEVEGREILLNLLLNAAEAIGQGGRVEVSARVVDDASAAEIVVRDDGAGMDEAVLARAAEPGFSTRPDGSGEGLARATELAQQAGGALGIDSAPGSGTRVTVRLPLLADPS